MGWFFSLATVNWVAGCRHVAVSLTRAYPEPILSLFSRWLYLVAWEPWSVRPTKLSDGAYVPSHLKRPRT